MAVEKDCILWPVRFDSTSYAVKVIVGATTTTCAMTVTADRNYWTSGDGQADSSTNNGTGDLCAILEACLNTHAATSGFSVSVSASGFLTISVSGGLTFSIEWGDAATTLDPVIFGFTAATYNSTGSSLEAPNQTKGIWYSDKTRSTDSRDRQPVLGAVAETISGLARVSRLSLPKKTRELGWQFIPQAKSLDEYAAATEPSGSFESAWLNGISKGYEFRVYDDASTRTSSSYGLYRVRSMDEPLTRSSAPVRFDIALSCARAD